MTSLIKNGLEWMKPLLDFRDRLVLNRNISELQEATDVEMDSWQSMKLVIIKAHIQWSIEAAFTRIINDSKGIAKTSY